ncbi:hypothetical protein G7Y89_g679 [Cudoniella acicularis]|uniref:Uncharacterized protein n=1 Tax=Cudoniella acicularis TaxID=354080 RepID=A0A8H4W8N2_9HELO|nr:hypothetical protein G7Y89_g679 [Cudoniella acicularis]
MKPSIFHNVLLAVPALCSAILKPRNPFDTTASVLVKPRYSDIEVASLLRSAGNEKLPILQRQNTNTTNTTTHVGGVALATQFNDFEILDIDPGSANELSLLITCISCYTTGSGTVILPALHTNNKALQILEDIGEGLLALIDPLAAIDVAVSGGLNITLSNFSGHFEFDIALAAEGVYEYEVFSIGVPFLGIGLDGNDIGVQFALSFVFDVKGFVNFTTGFDINFPNDTFLEMDLFRGELIKTDFGDVQFSPIPIHVIEGEGDFSISLRASIEAGLGINLGSLGFDLEAGVSIDLPTYEASITYDSSAACELDFTELIAIDAAAFATAAIKVDFKEKSAGPSRATTFISHTLLGTCIANQTSLPATSTFFPSLTPSSVTVVVTPITLSSTAASISMTTALNYTTSLPINPPVIITNAVNLTTLATPAVGKFNAATPVSGASIGNVTTIISTATPSFIAIANATLSALISSLSALAPPSSAYIVVTAAPTTTSSPSPTVALSTTTSASIFSTPTASPTKKSGAVAWGVPSLSAVFMLLAISLFFTCFT